VSVQNEEKLIMDIIKSIKQFHQDGFLIIPDALSQMECDQLKSDLNALLPNKKSRAIQKRMFEHSKANLELFWKEPVVTFAEELIADNLPDNQTFEGGIPSANEVHVIHNNSFKIPAGSQGLGKSSWHQDDTPHVVSLDGKPLTNVRVNVLAFTCLYYLTDVSTLQNGPTEFIKGSHLFGKACTGDISGYEDQIVTALGRAGTCVMINNQVWHRGSANTSIQDRYCTQITYAKRLVGHKYAPFMNYEMPKEVYESIDDPRKLRLLGFLGNGAYG
jgi:hypothetical protein